MTISRSQQGHTTPAGRSGSSRWAGGTSSHCACLFALFPIAYVVSAAFNADQSLGGSSLVPGQVTFENPRNLQDESTGRQQFCRPTTSVGS
jgi:ABC-type maltose transport system permease subunit